MGTPRTVIDGESSGIISGSISIGIDQRDCDSFVGASTHGAIGIRNAEFTIENIECGISVSTVGAFTEISSVRRSVGHSKVYGNTTVRVVVFECRSATIQSIELIGSIAIATVHNTICETCPV